MSCAVLSHDIVICTRNRPIELKNCLASIAGQRLLPSTVLIVDASDPTNADVVDALSRRIAGADVVVVHAPPSTAAQRNLGVGLSKADVVHFLDDDTVLEPGYLAAIMAIFDTDAGIGDDRILGVGGQPTNLPPGRPGRLQRLLQPESTRPGAVLPSGRGVAASGLTRRTDVGWLSGCCMSFRRDVLLDERFDERGDGYVLGEDLELSHRVRQRGRLVVEPAARLVHLESPRNRWDRRRWARTDVVNRHHRVRSGIEGYSASAFWLDGLLQLGLWSVRSLRPGANDSRSMAVGIAEGLALSAKASAMARLRQRDRNAT